MVDFVMSCWRRRYSAAFIRLG